MMLEKIFRLDDKVVVITGATGLLGKKHAEAVACYGGIPILIDLSEDKVRNLAEELKNKFNIESKGYALDITKEESVKLISDKIVKHFGKIDCLVNNAANNPKVEANDKVNFSRLENFQSSMWNDDIKVGLTGSFLCAKYFGYQISLNPKGGSIVNISSDLGLISPDQRLYAKEGLEESLQPVKPVSYSVVKSGIIGLSRYLSTYWADKNVRCNTLCPGGVKNDQPEEFLLEINNRIPMSRMANVNEYQGVLIWMLSDASSYLNGAIIPVDGGRTSW
jgi:NAD(P)-dependent dehydrogenase (short-subunit alcohol dehydrogenase family)